MGPSSKIVGRDQLLEIRGRAKQAGKTVVHCHGCFDIVHPGHIQHLQFARSLGDILVVSVSADSQVNKGIDRPLIPDELRAGSLAALECVDWVFVNASATAVELLEALGPDIYVKGKEYEQNQDPRFLAEREAVLRHGGRVVFSSGDVVYSSTALIEAMESKLSFNEEKLRRYRDRHDLGPAAAHAILNRFAGKRVVVVGDYILDRYHFCDAVGVAAEGPMMALRRLDGKDYDGGAAVIALHLAGLGAEATLVSGLADDELSRQVELRLRGAGVKVRANYDRRQVVVKNRYLVDQTKLMKLDEGSQAPLDSRAVRWAAETILAAAQGAAAVVLADFGYGMISAGLLQEILRPLRQSVPILAADVSGRQSSLLQFAQVDLLCPSEREAREALHDFSSGLGAVAWNLLHATGARQAILTLGKQGLVTFDRPAASAGDGGRLQSEYLPAVSGLAVDPLGCGDALLATASLTLAVGGSLQAAAYLGSLAAAIEVRQLGNVPISIEKLRAAIEPLEAVSAAA